MVELRIYPPLYYRMSSQRVGILVLEQAIGQGETLGELLGRLADGCPDAWQDIYDALARKVRPVVVTSLNGRALASAAVSQVPLSDGDRVMLHLAYGGG